MADRGRGAAGTGRKGASLRPVATPDKIETHEARQCTHGQGALTSAMADGAEKRRLSDIPEPRIAVTEHQAAILSRPLPRGCRAAFPEGIAGQTQYGSHLRQTAPHRGPSGDGPPPGTDAMHVRLMAQVYPQV